MYYLLFFSAAFSFRPVPVDPNLQGTFFRFAKGVAMACKWKVVAAKGETPTPRYIFINFLFRVFAVLLHSYAPSSPSYGHGMAVVGDSAYMFGGTNGQTMSSDTFKLDCAFRPCSPEFY